MISAASIGDLAIHLNETYAIASGGFSRRAIPRVSRSKRPRAHGSWNETSLYEGAIFSLSGYVRGDTVAAANEALANIRAAFALDGGSALLRYTYEGDAAGCLAYVRQDGDLNAPLSGSAPLIPWAVDVVAADPREYSQDMRTWTIDPTQAGSTGGISFPLSFPLSFGAAYPSGVVTVSNDGTYPTPPVYRIDGPAIDPVISNETTGRSIVTSGLTLAAGEVVEIDVDARRLTLQGTRRPDLIVAATTAWDDIPRGQSNIRMTGSGFVSGQSLLTVQFRDARI